MLNEWLKEHSNFIDEKYNVEAAISLNDNVLYINFIYNEENVRLPLDLHLPIKSKKALQDIIKYDVITIIAGWEIEDYVKEEMFEMEYRRLVGGKKSSKDDDLEKT